jgi:hypothetical protein
MMSLALSGCGRVGFDGIAADGAGANDDSGDPSAPRCAWTTPTVGAPVLQVALNTTNFESDPQLVRGDPLTMYFSRSAGSAQFDVFVATRPALDQLFGAPTLVTDLSTGTALEQALQLDAAGHGYYVAGPVDNTDIYEVQRDGGGSLTVVRGLAELETGSSEFDPFATADDLTLWFVTRESGNQDLYISTRASTAELWSPPASFLHNTSGEEGGASLTSDGLTVVWASGAPGASSDIYFATRTTTGSAWSAPQLLGPGIISTAAHDLEPSIREDGCELLFARSSAATDSNWDIYSVSLQ